MRWERSLHAAAKLPSSSPCFPSDLCYFVSSAVIPQPPHLLPFHHFLLAEWTGCGCWSEMSHPGALSGHCCPFWPSPIFPYKNLPSSLLCSSPSLSLSLPPILPKVVSSSACLGLSTCVVVVSSWWVRALVGALCSPELEGVFLLYMDVWDLGLDLGNCIGHAKITTNFANLNFLLDAPSQQ